MALPLFAASFRMGDLQYLRNEYRKLPPALAKKHIRSALRKTVEPFLPEFRAKAPKKTGALKKSPITKADFDRVSGDWTARVGYGRSKTKRGHHAILVNDGTKQRKTKAGKNTGKMPATHFADSLLASVRSRGLNMLETHMYAALESAKRALPEYLKHRRR
jgi:HK97 gp10 family phage protein